MQVEAVDATAGNIFTDTTYNGMGRVATKTNPYRSTSEPTYGTTTYKYDALGRSTKVIPPDGSESANNASTQYIGNITTATDEAGNQRKSYTESLGRLVEIDEPGAPMGTGSPGAPASPSTGSVTLTGSERTTQTGGQSAAPGSGSVTIGGSTTRKVWNCYYDEDLGRNVCAWVYDYGTVQLAVNGYTKSYYYNTSDSASTVASALASAFNGDGGSPVSASASGGTITFTARSSGAGTNYPVTQASFTLNTDFFTGTSFPVTLPPGNTLTGGRDYVAPTTIYDQGNVTVTIDGYPKTVSYGQGSTLSSIASSIASQFNGDANSPATGLASAGTVTFTSRLAGGSTNYSLSASSVTTQTGYFSGTSFPISTSGGSMTGGADAVPAVPPGPTGPLTFDTPYVTKYTYNVLDNLTCVEQHGYVSGTGCDQPEGSDATSPWRVRRFDYNSLSELTRAKNPESGAVNYYYNDDGTLTSKADARGITINYNPTDSPIDVLHRVTKKTYTNGDSSVSYFYDQTSYNGLTITNGVGQRTGMSDSSGVSAWSYDLMGRPLAVRRTISGSTKDFTYAYDLAGSVQTLTYPTQGGQARTVNYRANALGWPKSAYETSRTYALADQADAYAPQGALGHAVLGSVVTLTNSYQNRLQPNTLSATAGGNTLMSRTYDFHRNSGNNGNVYGITDNLDALNIANRPTGSATFTYDALNRLTQAKSTGTDCTQLPGATKNWGNSYSLDPWGNLINKGVPSPNLPGCLAESLSEIVGVDNRFTGAGRYDASGNMTQNGAYVYDAENRLKTAAATTYTYDGDGNRVIKTGATNMIYWRGAGADALAEGTSSNLTAEYIFFGGKRVARVDNPGASETVHYYISDHLGSATVIASSSGTVEKEEMYFPYGGERWANGGDGNHYKFTGKEQPASSGRAALPYQAPG